MTCVQIVGIIITIVSVIKASISIRNIMEILRYKKFIKELKRNDKKYY